MEVTFEIAGEPRGKGRPRFRRIGNSVQTYTPKETTDYELAVKQAYLRQCGGIYFENNVGIDVRIVAYFGIPKSATKKDRAAMLEHRKRPTKKIDVDNLVKCLLDAGNGTIYYDDKQVVDLQVRKFYGETPKVVVKIKSIEMEDKHE